MILLLDHQNGLFQTVKDVPLAELRTNTVVLAKVAKLAKIPLITTASVPDGPNGPLMHELQEVAPDATYVPRKGEIARAGIEPGIGTVLPMEQAAEDFLAMWEDRTRGKPIFTR